MYIFHYNDVTMTTMASQITSLAVVYSIVYSGADQRKHQSSASLAFVRGIHRSPVNSLHKGPVTRKLFPFGDVIMYALFGCGGPLCSSYSSGLLYWRWGSIPWWLHQMETFAALLALCAGNSPVTGEFHAQRPVTRSFDVFFDLRLNQQLSKQCWGRWFETQSCPLWRHCNEDCRNVYMIRMRHCYMDMMLKYYPDANCLSVYRLCPCWLE